MHANSTTFTPLLKIRDTAGIQRLFLKDESVQTNGTFKDRLSRKAVESAPAGTTFGVISYGNTAVSLARFVAQANEATNAGHQVVVYLPLQFENWIFGPTTSHTTITGKQVLDELRHIAHLIPFDSSTQIYGDSDLIRLALEEGVETNNFLNVTEGLAVPAYVDIIKEVIAQLGEPPDICIVPYGAGILCNEIKDHLQSTGIGEVIPLSVADPTSLAKMLYGPIWVNVEELQRKGRSNSRHHSPDRTGAPRHSYPVYLVTREEIESGMHIARKEGVSAEPSGAVGLGVLPRLHELYPTLDRDKDLVVVINTGNGIDGFLKNGSSTRFS